jgi:hypothetical protein
MGAEIVMQIGRKVAINVMDKKFTGDWLQMGGDW